MPASRKKLVRRSPRRSPRRSLRRSIKRSPRRSVKRSSPRRVVKSKRGSRRLKYRAGSSSSRHEEPARPVARPTGPPTLGEMYSLIEKKLDELKEMYPPFRAISDLCTDDGEYFSWNDEALDMFETASAKWKAVVSSMHSICLQLSKYREAVYDSNKEEAREHLKEVIQKLKILEGRIEKAFGTD